MNIHLLKYTDTKLHAFELMDNELLPPPDKTNPWALYCAWMIDWIVAYLLVQVTTGAWWSFMASLGGSSLPSAIQELIINHMKVVELILVPLYFFTMNYIGLCFHGKTLGQKLFKHKVEFKNTQGLWLYAFATTVSSALGGLPLLTNWIDELSQSETHSLEYAHFQFSQISSEEKDIILNLLQIAEENALKEESWSQAA